MGVLQMAESEISGNARSKGQEKPRKTSTESSQSPKAAQPSCLRGALVRIFLKRAEPNNKTEEDPTNNQNTEEQEGVRGKKRRVAGSIFRLPCLRPAETTGNDIQDKTEEQGNDIVHEEDLKPYSKASFLRKIRCYRLMRERDATEKEKVIEMAHRKHDRENTEVKEYKERVVEHNEEGLQNINHDEGVKEEGKDRTEQGCQVKGLGEASNNFQEQENIGAQEECCTGKLLGEESMKTEDPAQGLGGMCKDLAEQEICVDTSKEKSVLSEGEGSLTDDKKLAEQESQIEKVEKKELVLAEDCEEDMVEQNNCAAKIKDLDNTLSDNMSQSEVVGKQEKQEAMEKYLPKQDKEESPGAVQKYPENKCHTDVLGIAGNYLLEQEDAKEKVGITQNDVSGQQCLEKDTEDTRDCFSEQAGHKEKEGNTENNVSGHQHVEENTRNCLPEHDCQKEDKELDMTKQDSQGDVVDKMGKNPLEKDSAEESHVEIGDDQENNLVGQDSHVEKEHNFRKEISQHGSQNIAKDSQAETLGKLEDKTMEVSGVPLDAQDEQNVTHNMSKQGLTMTIMNQETCQLQGSPAKTPLGSEENEKLLASLIHKTTDNNIINCMSSEEAHIQVLELQKEMLTSTNAMDLNYKEEHILHKCVSDEGDGMGSESADLGSLREEVQDMVEWLVQEASDRLSNYKQESEDTG